MNAPLAKEQIALLMSDSLTYRASIVEGTDGTIADARPTFGQMMMQRVTRAMKDLMALPHRRAVLDELNMLSDRELSDIGLSRADMGRVFDKSFATHRRG